MYQNTLFFKIFKVNFDGECSYFTKNMICNFPSCAVCQCEDEDVSKKTNMYKLE